MTFSEFAERVFGGENGTFDNSTDRIWQSNVDEDGLLLIALPGAPASCNVDFQNHSLRIACCIGLVADVRENRALIDTLPPGQMLSDDAGWLMRVVENNDCTRVHGPTSLYTNAIWVDLEGDDDAEIMADANRVMQIILPRWDAAVNEMNGQTPAAGYVV